MTCSNNRAANLAVLLRRTLLAWLAGPANALDRSTDRCVGFRSISVTRGGRRATVIVAATILISIGNVGMLASDAIRSNVRHCAPSAQKGLDPLTAVLPQASIPPSMAQIHAARAARFNVPNRGPLTSWQIGVYRLEESPTPLPVPESDAVAILRIVGFQPYLSEDGTSIFTEFRACVERPIKGDLEKYDEIVVLRPGGRLRTPEGTLSVETMGPGLPPRPGLRYLLFLKQGPTADYTIVKGYELRRSRGYSLSGKADTVQSAFDGVTELRLIRGIEELMRTSGTK